MIHEEEIKPIHISDIEALEKAIIDDVTARRLALLRQTVDACYHKKFMDKASEWLCSVQLDYYAEHKKEFLEDFKKAMEQ